MVWFDYLAGLTSLGKLANPILEGDVPKWFKVDDDIYILIRYEALIFAFRENKDGDVGFFGTTGNIICLNGNVIMQPIVRERKSNLILPDNLKRKESNLECTVVYVGKANEEYLDGTQDSNWMQPGDNVVLKNYKIRLENDLANELAPGLVFMQQKYVWAQVVNSV